MTGFTRDFINRRPAQTFADSIFSLADLSKENLHAFRQTGFLPKK
jgi:hypothetical protein